MIEVARLPDKRRTLLVTKGKASTPGTVEDAKGALEDPDEGEDGKGERGPMHELGGGLVGENGPQGPCDGNGSGKIALRGGEGIGGGCALEEETAKESLEGGLPK